MASWCKENSVPSESSLLAEIAHYERLRWRYHPRNDVRGKRLHHLYRIHVGFRRQLLAALQDGAPGAWEDYTDQGCTETLQHDINEGLWLLEQLDSIPRSRLLQRARDLLENYLAKKHLMLERLRQAMVEPSIA